MQMTSLKNQLTETVTTTFTQSLRLIRIAMHKNALFTIATRNWQFFSDSPKAFVTIHTKPIIYNMSTTSCSCALTPLCAQVATIDNIILPGLMVGCFPLESLLKSNLNYCIIKHLLISYREITIIHLKH
ncbi:hypothetical protein I4U23_027948 [Adineta vaga]|nr:hypothetical protein I4U23_027948 [Adineta vaga]